MTILGTVVYSTTTSFLSYEMSIRYYWPTRTVSQLVPRDLGGYALVHLLRLEPPTIPIGCPTPDRKLPVPSLTKMRLVLLIAHSHTALLLLIKLPIKLSGLVGVWYLDTRFPVVFMNVNLRNKKTFLNPRFIMQVSQLSYLWMYMYINYALFGFELVR